jgi:hypothetical protein
VTGILAAVGNSFGGTGGGGGSALVSVTQEGETASDFNNSSWTFNDNTCTASGGTPPYSYAWTWTGTSGGTFGFSGSSTNPTCTPIVTAVAFGSGATGTLICTVTDSALAVDASPGADYAYENFGL